MGKIIERIAYIVCMAFATFDLFNMWLNGTKPSTFSISAYGLSFILSALAFFSTTFQTKANEDEEDNA